MNSQSWTCTKGVTSFGGAFPGNRSLFIFPSVRLHSVARTNSCERTAASSISASSGSAFFHAVREGTEIAPDGIVQGFAKLGDVLQLIDATPVLPDTAGIDVVRKRAQHCAGAPIPDLLRHRRTRGDSGGHALRLVATGTFRRRFSGCTARGRSSQGRRSSRHASSTFSLW